MSFLQFDHLADNFSRSFRFFRNSDIFTDNFNINAVADKAGLSKKDSDAAVNAVLCAITDALKAGDKVQLVGFGSFETKKRAARTGQNPRTGAAVEIPASTVPTFKAGKALKDAVAK